MIIIFGTDGGQRARDLITPVLGEGNYQFARQGCAPIGPTLGNVVVVMGSEAFKQYQAKGIFPKNRALTSSREKPVRLGPSSGFIICSFAPGMIVSDAAAAAQIRWDLKLAKRLHDNGHADPIIGEYKWLSGPEFETKAAEICARADAAGSAGVPVAHDLETMGFWPWYADKRIITYQFTDQEGKGYAVYLDDLKSEFEKIRFVEALTKLLTHPNVKSRGANLKFDLMWIRLKLGIVCTNFKMDSLLIGSLLDENRSNGLSWHTKEYAPDLGGYDKPLEDKYDKGHMELIPRDDPDFLTYAAGDVDSALRVSNQMINEIRQDPALMNFYVHLLHPAARAFEDIEFDGLLVDKAKYTELETALNAEIAAAYSECIRGLSPRLRAKHCDNLSLDKPSLKLDHLFGPLGYNLKPLKFTSGGASGENKKPATDRAHLQMFADHPTAGPWIKSYLRWSNAAKMLGTYVHGFLEYLRPDGRFHPTYMLFNGEMFGNNDDSGGTVTGRLSCKNPALQTVPKHQKKDAAHNWPKMIRSCYPAPEGYVFFEADYSQGELRVCADIANETNMLAAYEKGLDLHCVMGASNMGIPYDEFYAYYQRMDAKDPTLDPKIAADVKRFRQQAKAQNFGLMYGMGPDGFRIYARDSYGVHLTEKEAAEAHATFFKTYPGLIKYHKKYKDTAYKTGRVTSPLGRVRHLSLVKSPDREAAAYAERQSVNSPVQSTLSDMCLLSISIINRELRSEGVRIAGMTHDSIYGYIRADVVEAMARRITGIMSNLPLEKFGWNPKLKFPADIQVGPSWGEMKTLKLEPEKMAA